MADIRDSFSVRTFSDAKMKSMLSHDTYETLSKIRAGAAEWNDSVADEVAGAMYMPYQRAPPTTPTVAR